MYCSTLSSVMVGVRAEEQRESLAFHAHVARVVLHHVQDVLHRLGGDGDLRCRKKLVTQPCFWLSNISQNTFWCSKGIAPGVFLFWSPVIFWSMSPVNPALAGEG